MHTLTQEEITKGNILLAEFMGGKYLIKQDHFHQDRKLHYILYEKGVVRDEIWNGSQSGSVENPTIQLMYHQHFYWLMPVLQRIRTIPLKDAENPSDTHYCKTFGMINAETGETMVRINGMRAFYADTLIQAAWLAAVDFVELFNEEMKKANTNKP